MTTIMDLLSEEVSALQIFIGHDILRVAKRKGKFLASLYRPAVSEEIINAWAKAGDDRIRRVQYVRNSATGYSLEDCLRKVYEIPPDKPLPEVVLEAVNPSEIPEINGIG